MTKKFLLYGFLTVVLLSLIFITYHLFAGDNKYFSIFSVFNSMVEEKTENALKTTEIPDPDTKIPKMEDYRKFPLINYKRIKIHNHRELDSLRRVFGGRKRNNWTAAYRAISTLNRKEYMYYRVHDSITVPDKIVDDQRAYSILPQYYPAAKNIHKLIVVSIKYQCYGAYEYGDLVRFASINSGKRAGANPIGLYYLHWKARHHYSSIDSTWYMPFTFNFTADGQAFHQYQMPGWPASHGCLRQFNRDAEWLFGWGETRKRNPETNRRDPRSGTPVLIIDSYNFKTRYKAWRYLESNQATIKLPENPLSFEEKW